MSIPLYNLFSPIHDENSIDHSLEKMITELEGKLGEEFLEISEDEIKNYSSPLIFIKSGGVEGYFKEIYQHFQEPYTILASDTNNSLAASLEILTFLKQQGLKAEIIHGDVSYLASRINIIQKAAAAKQRLNGINVGAIGKPSDWLIASNVDYRKVENTFGIKVIELEITELLAEIEKVTASPNLLADLKNGVQERNIKSLYQEAPDEKSLDGALNIYLALKNICIKYHLQGLTIRCFDLLNTVYNTGCIALALLNDEGIISACEGDLPALIIPSSFNNAALLSMMILNTLTEEPVFMANPSSIDTKSNQIILAHCTLPLSMADLFTLNTHFESKIGVGIHGEIRSGEATIFRLNADLKRYFVSGITILENQYKDNLCRTQIKVKMHESAQYLLLNPMGNHHLICKGDYTSLVNYFMDLRGLHNCLKHPFDHNISND